MAIDVNWFQSRVRDLGTSQRQISAAIASNPNTLSLILSGKRRVSHEELPQLAQLLDTTAEELLKRLGVEAPVAARENTTESVGTVDESGRVHVGDRRAVPSPANARTTTRAVMYDKLGDHRHGWLFYFEDYSAKPHPVDADSLDALCVVEVDGKTGQLLAVVRRSTVERGRYDLLNPISGSLIVGAVVVRSASPVTWIKTS